MACLAEVSDAAGARLILSFLVMTLTAPELSVVESLPATVMVPLSLV